MPPSCCCVLIPRAVHLPLLLGASSHQLSSLFLICKCSIYRLFLFKVSHMVCPVSPCLVLIPNFSHLPVVSNRSNQSSRPMSEALQNESLILLLLFESQPSKIQVSWHRALKCPSWFLFPSLLTRYPSLHTIIQLD